LVPEHAADLPLKMPVASAWQALAQAVRKWAKAGRERSPYSNRELSIFRCFAFATIY